MRELDYKAPSDTDNNPFETFSKLFGQNINYKL